MSFDIDVLAQLARIQLSAQEKQQLSGDLQKILTHVEKINALPIDGVTPMSHILSLENVFRPDEVKEQKEIAGRLFKTLPATSKEGHFFKVPKVVEREE